MKRNVISLIKFLFVATFAVLLTIVVFRYVRGPRLSIAGSPHSLNIFGGDKNYPNGQLEEKIDWHDYKKMKEDSSRVGIGEQGKPATLSQSKRLTEDKLYKVNGFNAALSDEISLNRSVPDIRHPDCKKKTYLKNLNSISVIVSFHNEHFTTLLRTCWSVINRSPPELLKEIILVDDASTKVELKDKLDRYLASHLPKVSVIRLPQRSGLIRGRLAGAKKAKAKILVFLDSHTEANVNWLPPLIEPITKDYKTCMCPLIDVIAFDTFEYRAQDEGARGAFDWELYYKRLPLLPADLANPSEPFKNPVMAGGLFAISAKFFWELGGYDPGLDIWGGEQYELSFKIWQYPGDLSVQKALREKLNCKPFKWFMENIAFDLVDTYPPVEPEDFALGEIRNIGVPELCLDAKRRAKNEAIAVDLCVKDNVKVANGEQEFRLTWRKDIRPKTRTDCLDVSSGVAKAPVTLYPCHGQQGNQRWRYDVEKQWLLHGLGDRCLDTDPATKKVFVSACDPASSTQKWRIHE
ncbi:hypothetical protein G9C98_005279, partial [Cotesia typhae]